MERVTIIGAGIAGCEAAWQLAVRGIPVRLHEMRPEVRSLAHHTSLYAELVCSNSFKSDEEQTAAGLLKRELEDLGSLVMKTARRSSVPAGAALAVDREHFSRTITEAVTGHPGIEVVTGEATSIPEGDVIVAAGPLASDAIAAALSEIVGAERLAFFDAAAPIVDASSIDGTIAFPASRWSKGEETDYLNCPLDRPEYEAFVEALISARRVTVRDFEKRELFQACQPIEEIARSGVDAIRYGALKPVGIIDPRTGLRPWAVVQLRAETRDRTAYNLVGFQTNLAFPEQERVIRMIPGLGDARILRYGVMHRNTFVDAPKLLTPSLAVRQMPRLRLAGQITGTEGYLEAAASGLLAALDVFCDRMGHPAPVLPSDTALGSLIAYATSPDTTGYQPMHVNFGLVPPLDPPVRGKRERYAAYSARARTSMRTFLDERPDLVAVPAIAGQHA